MQLVKPGIALWAGSMLTAAAPIVHSQLPAPNEGGVSTGHIHLTVPNVAKHGEIWKLIGGVEKFSGRLRMYAFPGMYILLSEGQPTAASSETTANHIGFSVRDYDLYKAKLEAVNAQFIFDSEENKQIIADLPDGVRVEILGDSAQEQPVVFHHIHLAAADVASLRDWYVQVLSAEPGERRGLPSALVPGGRVDVLGARGEQAPLPSKGTAIDHIGFEVADMDEFAAGMERAGIKFDRVPTRIEAIGLTIAFLTDPVGTYIEITEGLDDVQ